MGEAAATPEVLRAMVESLMEDPDLPGDVAGALREMGPSAATPEVVEALAERLRRELGPEHRYPEDDVLRECLSMAAALAAAGEAARPEVVRTFREVLRRWEPRLVRDAARTLGEMGPSAAVPGILQVLAECIRKWYPGKEARREVLRTLRKMGRAAAVPEVLEALRELLRKPDPEAEVLRVLAARTLWAILGEASPDVLRVLAEGLRTPGSETCLRALRTVRDMGPPAARPDVLRLVAKRLWDEDPFVRAAAAEALRAMGAADPEILGALEELLQVEKTPWVREAAGLALEALRSRSGPGGSA
jgi:HEAT repeat protein